VSRPHWLAPGGCPDHHRRFPMTAGDGSARSGARPPRPAGAGGDRWAAWGAGHHRHGYHRRSHPERCHSGYCRLARGAAGARGCHAGRDRRHAGLPVRRSRRRRRSGRPEVDPRGAIPGWMAGAGAGCRRWNATRSRPRRGRHRRRSAGRPMAPVAPGRTGCLSHCVPVYGTPRLIRRAAASRRFGPAGPRGPELPGCLESGLVVWQSEQTEHSALRSHWREPTRPPGNWQDLCGRGR